MQLPDSWHAGIRNSANRLQSSNAHGTQLRRDVRAKEFATLMGENEELLARPPEEIFKEGTKKMNILEVIETETPGDLEVYINGQWQRSNTTEYQEVKNPATGEMLGKVPIATLEDVDDAVQAALRAFPGWRRTPPEDRIQNLFRLKQLLEDHS